ERDRRTIGRANTTLRAQNEELRPEQLLRLPSHPGCLREPKQIAARPGAQHLIGQRQLALRSASSCLHIVKSRIGRFEQRRQRWGRAGHLLAWRVVGYASA